VGAAVRACSFTAVDRSRHPPPGGSGPGR